MNRIASGNAPNAVSATTNTSDVDVYFGIALANTLSACVQVLMLSSAAARRRRKREVALLFAKVPSL